LGNSHNTPETSKPENNVLRSHSIESLIRELSTLRTPELIAESTRLTILSDPEEKQVIKMRAALAGAFAAEKIPYYLESLRIVNGHRTEIGQGILAYRQTAAALHGKQDPGAHEADLFAKSGAGLQEVAFHFFAICIQQIHRLLPIAARASGVKIPREIRDSLRSYEPLRHYFEHLDERLPGRINQDEVVLETRGNTGWSIKIGFNVDAMGRIILNGHPVDVTSRGVRVVELAVQEVWEQIRSHRLAEVCEHFLKCSDPIPPPDSVRRAPLVSLKPLDDVSGINAVEDA
jgi:hypothetical protein